MRVRAPDCIGCSHWYLQSLVFIFIMMGAAVNSGFDGTPAKTLKVL
jgi:hypothetical protein